MTVRPRRRGFVLGTLALSIGGSAWWWLRAEGNPGTVTTDRYGDQHQTVPKDQLPEFVRSGGAKVGEAYRFALAQPAALESVPCFCGCGKIGHRSNLDCYVKAVHADGRVTYTKSDPVFLDTSLTNHGGDQGGRDGKEVAEAGARAGRRVGTQ